MTSAPKRQTLESLGVTCLTSEAEKLAARLSFAADVPRWKAEWDALQTTPEWRAMKKLEAGIAALQADPEITANEMCKDLLELLQQLLERAWPHHDVKKIVAPMQAHFDGERSKKALDKKQEKKDNERHIYSNFLDEQKDIFDTPRLATRLRKAFGINSVRGAEDEVRRWKKLRDAGKTEGTGGEASKKTGSAK
ncbi:hypothetical protein [Acidovorax sp. JHL-9]|uniref:hypothetical protein n=1 Tax=Acidovorax sp. JHL-9 TaxID=1276756 RepID=UPI0004028045|nr:hypothetical protein [Acidovorax sp. JHL-9]